MKIVAPLAIVCTLLLASCAKKEGESAAHIEDQSLRDWVAAHVTDPTLKEHEGGLYTVVLQAAPASATIPAEGDWVEIRYTGYSMPDLAGNPTGDVFVTRDSLIAVRQLATNKYYTHYAPKKVLLSPYTGLLTEAMYRTLRMMGEGAKWRFYAPSSLTYGSYGSSYSSGYQGQYALPGGKPSYMDIELVRVIKDVQADERSRTASFAQSHLGIAQSDSLKYYLYLKNLPNDPAQAQIKRDSSMHIYYVARFVDGFILDTNIDSVAQRYRGDFTTHKALTYTPSDSTALIMAFYYATLQMKYDSWGRMVFSSDYGYGYNGQTPSSDNGVLTEVDPYTPLYFDFYIPPYEEPVKTIDFTTDPLLAGWKNQKELGSQQWTYTPQMLSVVGNVSATDVWLISPALKLVDYTKLNLYLDHRFIKGNGSTGDIRLYYSVASPSATFSVNDWTEITMPSVSPGAFQTTGPIQLDAYNKSNNLRIALRYNSGAGVTSSWDIRAISFKARP